MKNYVRASLTTGMLSGPVGSKAIRQSSGRSVSPGITPAAPKRYESAGSSIHFVSRKSASLLTGRRAINTFLTNIVVKVNLLI
jgi:hypothetical protein